MRYFVIGAQCVKLYTDCIWQCNYCVFTTGTALYTAPWCTWLAIWVQPFLEGGDRTIARWATLILFEGEDRDYKQAVCAVWTMVGLISRTACFHGLTNQDRGLKLWKKIKKHSSLTLDCTPPGGSACPCCWNCPLSVWMRGRESRSTTCLVAASLVPGIKTNQRKSSRCQSSDTTHLCLTLGMDIFLGGVVFSSQILQWMDELRYTFVYQKK